MMNVISHRERRFTREPFYQQLYIVHALYLIPLIVKQEQNKNRPQGVCFVLVVDVCHFKVL